MKKVKSYKSDTVPANQMILRMVDVQRERADIQTKTVPVVIASEMPVERYDEQRGDVYAEILDMGGVKFRTERRQLPIVDSHDRSTVRNVLGSVRNIRVEGSQLVGDATFARDSDSQIAFDKLMDGHLTDFSITATPVAARQVKRGDTGEFRGGSINGPAVIITEWTPTDASLVAAGADASSTVRELLRSYDTQDRKVKRMLSDELKAALVAKGMPEQLSSAEEAVAWAVGVIGTIQGPEVPEVVPDPVAEPVVEPVEMAMDEPEEKPEEEKEEVEEVVARALANDRKRQKEILALCQQAKIERAFADDLCESGATLEIARHKVLERMMADNKPVGSSVRVEVTADSKDKFNKALGDALISRAASKASLASVKLENVESEFKYMPLLRMAEKSLERDGINTDRMSQRDIAMVAMGHRPTIERMRHAGIIRDAYHTTGSFPQLMADTVNRTLTAGYDETPVTWSMWARQAPSVADFRAINRVRFSEAPDLEVVPEGQDYPDASHSDQKETYRISKYGQRFSVTWETVVNDDLDAISRIPAMHGAAARRLEDKKVYEVLTANALMADAVALFGSHASGTNLAASAAAPSVTTLNAAFLAMMTQKGMTSSSILNIIPRYLIVPAALGATALELVNSTSYIVSNGNSGVQNIYGQGGVRSLTVIESPYLDGNSSTAWYMAAANSQIDTVELAFLQGEESPVLESEWNMDNDTYAYKVRKTFGVGAIDWRGVFKNAGA